MAFWFSNELYSKNSTERRAKVKEYHRRYYNSGKKNVKKFGLTMRKRTGDWS
jgi:hypothetical protein